MIPGASLWGGVGKVYGLVLRTHCHTLYILHKWILKFPSFEHPVPVHLR